MMPPLPSLPPEIEEALAIERRRPVQPDVRRRLLERIGTSVSLIPPGADVPSASGASGLGLASSKLILVGLIGAGVLGAVWFGSRPAALVAPVTAVGFGTAPQPAAFEPAPIGVEAQPEPQPKPTLDKVPAQRVRAAVRPSKPPEEPAVASPTAFEPAIDRPLEREQKLLELAQQQVTGRDWATAAARLAEHEQQFADGQLIEERELLAIKVLIGLSQSQEAGLRAARFLEQFPTSSLAPKVQALVERINLHQADNEAELNP